MLTVVSDSGPLIHLAQINRLQILQKLFGCIPVSASVKIEVVDQGIKRKCPNAAVVEAAFKDGWIRVEDVSQQALMQAAKLADGEGISLADAEVIILSKQKKALFLSDDIALLKIAEMYGLKSWDTWNLLLEALSNSLMTLAELDSALNELGKKKFSLNAKQAQEILDSAKLVEEHEKNQ